MKAVDLCKISFFNFMDISMQSRGKLLFLLYNFTTVVAVRWNKHFFSSNGWKFFLIKNCRFMSKTKWIHIYFMCTTTLLVYYILPLLLQWRISTLAFDSFSTSDFNISLMRSIEKLSNSGFWAKKPPKILGRFTIIAIWWQTES